MVLGKQMIPFFLAAMDGLLEARATRDLPTFGPDLIDILAGFFDPSHGPCFASCSEITRSFRLPDTAYTNTQANLTLA